MGVRTVVNISKTNTVSSESCYCLLMKVLRAESARAVTGRRCPHSWVGLGWAGEDFLARLLFFLRKGPFLGSKKLKNQSEGAKSTDSARSTNGHLIKSRVL